MKVAETQRVTGHTLLVRLMACLTMPVAGCHVLLPEGEYACAEEGDHSSCPDGMYCRVEETVSPEPRCYRTSGDAPGSNGGDNDDSGTPGLALLGAWAVSYPAYNTFVADDMAYLANGDNGVVILDVSDPSRIRELGKAWIERANYVVVDDSTAYVIQGGYSAGEPDELIVVDVDDSTDPRIVGSYSVPEEEGAIYSVSVFSSLVYLSGHCFIRILDFTNPENPEAIWTWNPVNIFEDCGATYKAQVDGDYLYMSDGFRSLYTYDQSNNSGPVELGEYLAPDWIWSFVVADGMAFIADGTSGLVVADVSDPDKELSAGSFQVETFAHQVEIFGDIGFVSYVVHEKKDHLSTELEIVDNGVVALDISNVNSMREIDKISGLVSLAEIQYVNNRLFVTTQTEGLLIYAWESQ